MECWQVVPVCRKRGDKFYMKGIQALAFVRPEAQQRTFPHVGLLAVRETTVPFRLLCLLARGPALHQGWKQSRFREALPLFHAGLLRNDGFGLRNWTCPMLLVVS